MCSCRSGPCPYAPRFSSVKLDLGAGKILRIEAPGADGRKLQYVAGVRIDGEPIERVWADWSQLRDGGTIAFELTAIPGGGWGTGSADLPASPCGLAR